MAIFLSNTCNKKKKEFSQSCSLAFILIYKKGKTYIYIKDVSSWSFKSINESALRFVTVNDYNLKRGGEICTATWVRKQYLNIKYSKQTNLIAYHLFNRCKKKKMCVCKYNIIFCSHENLNAVYIFIIEITKFQVSNLCSRKKVIWPSS